MELASIKNATHHVYQVIPFFISKIQPEHKTLHKLIKQALLALLFRVKRIQDQHIVAKPIIVIPVALYLILCSCV